MKPKEKFGRKVKGLALLILFLVLVLSALISMFTFAPIINPWPLGLAAFLLYHVFVFFFFVKLDNISVEKNQKQPIQSTRTARSRINDFLDFIKKISGDNDIYVHGEVDAGKFKQVNLNDWPGNISVTDIDSIYLFNKGLAIKWTGIKLGAVSYGDESYYSKSFEYAFAEGFPELMITVNKRLLTEKAEKFALLYKEQFGSEVKEIIIDD